MERLANRLQQYECMEYIPFMVFIDSFIGRIQVGCTRSEKALDVVKVLLKEVIAMLELSIFIQSDISSHTRSCQDPWN